ncbi:esterase-like activity of phytase family protein [Actinomycetes bacterium KLBMP 9759]
MSGTAVAQADPDGRSCSQFVAIESFSDALDKTDFESVYVGNLSALTTYENGDVGALSDRSALFTLDRTSQQPIAVATLVDEQGQPLDAEGLALDADDTVLVSSETEPSVRRYTRQGALLGRLPVPEPLLVAPPGRAKANATFEGLTLQPGGRTLVASMESPLTGDAEGIVRFPTWSRDGGSDFVPGPQLAYRVDDGMGVAEIRYTPDGRLLVLERTFVGGVGNTVRLYLADLAAGSDVSNVQDLSAADRVLPKTLLTDLVDCPTLGATAKQPQPNPLLDNIEGMTVLAAERDRMTVLLVSDDNQRPTQITRLYSLAVRLPAR